MSEENVEVCQRAFEILNARRDIEAALTIRDGAVERLCRYQERQEAFEAAGLQE
jgi:hypothetical protein